MLTEEQSQIIAAQRSTVIVGKPGTGKTYAMISKIQELIQAGIKPADIVVLAFSHRSMLVQQALLRKRLGDIADGLKLGTVRDFAMEALERVQSESPNLAENTLVRRYLRRAMKDVAFEGSVQEAEHIIRQFKGRGAKPQATEPHCDLFLSYKAILDQNHTMDRHDVARKHIIGMRNDVLQPTDTKYIFVDNIQDATQIQLLWLVDHHQAGVKVCAFGDDDLCIYGQDGALGVEAIRKLTDMYEFDKIVLSESFRYGIKLERLIEGFMDSVDEREDKPFHAVEKLKTDIEIQSFKDEMQEDAFVTEKVEEILRKNPGESIGIIVRHDLQGRKLERILQNKFGSRLGSLGKSLWDLPAALVIIDLLEVVLNKANDAQLKNLLINLGVAADVVDNLFVSGLHAHGWLSSGGFNAQEVLPEDQAHGFEKVQHQLLTYFMAAPKVGFKAVFKAAAFDLIQTMDEADKLDALHALDALLHLKGKVGESLATIKSEVSPDPLAQIVLAPVREIRNLEFDHVILPYIKEGIYPYPYKVLGENLEAEKRLLYSAMTRVRKDLCMTYSGQPSTYIKELEELL